MASSDEIYALMKYAMDPQAYEANYAKVKSDPGELWNKVGSVSGQVYTWPKSTYIAKPPFFDGFAMQPAAASTGVKDARALGIFGDSITTDHISPAGAIKDTSPAGQWLIRNKVMKADFNSYGARRGNHEVMMRGTFANVRIKNLMIPPQADGSRIEGGFTLYQPSGELMSIYDAAMKYIERRCADRRVRWRGIRHRIIARLGGQGHATARRQGGDRAQLRAYSSQQPGRYGGAAAAVHRQ